MIYYIYGILIKNFLYVGSTCDLNERRINHKSSCNNNNYHGHNYKVYRTIRTNGGWENCWMDVIDEVECQDETEITPIEEFYRVALGADLNGKKCHRTKQERMEYNREYKKKWKENNLDKCKEAHKKWRENNLDYYKRKYNCNCGGTYTYSHKAEHIKTKKHQEYLLKLTNI